MAKLVFILLSSFVLEVAFATAGAVNNQQRQLQQLSDQIQEVSNNVVNLIQNQRIGSNQEKQYLSWQANEYVQDIQNVIYNLQQAIQNNEKQQDQLQLQQIVRRLSEVAYSIRQAVNSEASQLRLQLRLNIQNVLLESERLAEIAQQLSNESRAEQNNLNSEVRLALDSILRAALRLQVQSRLQNKSQEEIKGQIQSLALPLSNAIDNANSEGEQAVRNLADRAWELARINDNVIDRLQRQLRNNNDAEVRNNLRDAVGKFSNIRTALDQAGGNLNTVAQAQELKNQLKSNINAIAEQIRKLNQLAQSENQNNPKRQLNEFLRSLVVDAVLAAESLQIQIRITGGQNN